jgi:hypothetical protein
LGPFGIFWGFLVYFWAFGYILEHLGILIWGPFGKNFLVLVCRDTINLATLTTLYVNAAYVKYVSAQLMWLNLDHGTCVRPSEDLSGIYMKQHFLKCRTAN